MKLYNIFLAYQSLQSLIKLRLPYNKTMQILRMRDNLKLHVEYYITEERKIVDSFKALGKATQDGNALNFAVSGDHETDVKNAAEYTKAINALRETETDLCYEVIDILPQELEEPNKPTAFQKISGECIDNLKDFIEFSGGD